MYQQPFLLESRGVHHARARLQEKKWLFLGCYVDRDQISFQKVANNSEKTFRATAHLSPSLYLSTDFSHLKHPFVMVYVFMKGSFFRPCRNSTSKTECIHRRQETFFKWRESSYQAICKMKNDLPFEAKKGTNWPKVLSKERRNKPHADKMTSSAMKQATYYWKLIKKKCSIRMPT